MDELKLRMIWFDDFFFRLVPWIITRPVLFHLWKYLWNRWQSVPGGLSLFFTKAHLWGNPHSWNLHLSRLNFSWFIGYHQDNVAPAGILLINAQKASVIHIKYPPSFYVSAQAESSNWSSAQSWIFLFCLCLCLLHANYIASFTSRTWM